MVWSEIMCWKNSEGGGLGVYPSQTKMINSDDPCVHCMLRNALAVENRKEHAN